MYSLRYKSASPATVLFPGAAVVAQLQQGNTQSTCPKWVKSRVWSVSNSFIRHLPLNLHNFTYTCLHEQKERGREKEKKKKAKRKKQLILHYNNITTIEEECTPRDTILFMEGGINTLVMSSSYSSYAWHANLIFPLYCDKRNIITAWVIKGKILLSVWFNQVRFSKASSPVSTRLFSQL